MSESEELKPAGYLNASNAVKVWNRRTNDENID